MIPIRRQARECAIQMLTAVDLNPLEDGNVVAFINDYWENLAELPDSNQKASKDRAAKVKIKSFANECVLGVMSNISKIDEIISGKLENWDLYRLGTVERAVLRLGVWEIVYTDNPRPVVINEAVDIANWFSSPKTRRIVNGVLDQIMKPAKTETAAAETAAAETAANADIGE